VRRVSNAVVHFPQLHSSQTGSAESNQWLSLRRISAALYCQKASPSLLMTPFPALVRSGQEMPIHAKAQATHESETPGNGNEWTGREHGVLANSVQGEARSETPSENGLSLSSITFWICLFGAYIRDGRAHHRRVVSLLNFFSRIPTRVSVPSPFQRCIHISEGARRHSLGQIPAVFSEKNRKTAF
jgi:hypothetical protein